MSNVILETYPIWQPWFLWEVYKLKSIVGEIHEFMHVNSLLFACVKKCVFTLSRLSYDIWKSMELPQCKSLPFPTLESHCGQNNDFHVCEIIMIYHYRIDPCMKNSEIHRLEIVMIYHDWSQPTKSCGCVAFFLHRVTLPL